MSRDGLSFEPDVLRVIYGRERQRRQPSDGVSQYVEMTGAFAQFAEIHGRTPVSAASRSTTTSTSR
jgi:hypothetical protein